jgi:hypothetical protein
LISSFVPWCLGGETNGGRADLPVSPYIWAAQQHRPTNDNYETKIDVAVKKFSTRF